MSPGVRTAPSVSRIVASCCAVVCVYVAAIGIVPADERFGTQRWLFDAEDIDRFRGIAQFYPSGQRPYLDVSSEYPPLATLVFAAPFLIFPGANLTSEQYRFRWTWLMALTLIVLVWLVARFRVAAGLGATATLLLLLPSTLYFSICRFDVLCALLVCVSLAAFCRERYVLAHLVLAAATFLKWYPALVFPVYAAFHLARESPQVMRHWSVLRSKAARYCAVYLGAVAAMVLASVTAFTWPGLLAPYAIQAGRGAQYFNLYWLLEQFRAPLGLDGAAAWQLVNVAFALLGFAIVPILLLKPVRSLADVFRYAVLAIYLFITFSRIDSPQWILWYVPPILMFVRDTRTLIALACLNTWNYLVFPVGFDRFGMTAATFSAIVLIKDIILLALVYFVLVDSGPTVRLARGRSASLPAGTNAASSL